MAGFHYRKCPSPSFSNIYGCHREGHQHIITLTVRLESHHTDHEKCGVGHSSGCRNHLTTSSVYCLLSYHSIQDLEFAVTDCCKKQRNNSLNLKLKLKPGKCIPFTEMSKVYDIRCHYLAHYLFVAGL